MTSAKRDRTTTRERILDAALDLFADEGYRATTITEIERRVGLSPESGSFYRHFASKEALLRAAVAREVARCRAQIAETHATPPVADDPHAEEIVGWERALQDIRLFDRLFRLVFTEGEHVPGLRDAVNGALRAPHMDVSFDEAPFDVIALAALTGYHFSSVMQGRPFQGVAEHDFVDALARLIEMSKRVQ